MATSFYTLRGLSKHKCALFFLAFWVSWNLNFLSFYNPYFHFLLAMSIFFTPVFYPALIWFMIFCKVSQTERQFLNHFHYASLNWNSFSKKFSIWLHAISSKELLDFIFSFWLLFFPLLKPIRWLGSVPPLGLFSSEYFGRQKILLGKCLLQWVTIGHNISKCVTLCCYNRSQCITISHNGLHCGTIIFTLC